MNEELPNVVPNQYYIKLQKAFGIDTSQQYPIQFLDNSKLVYFIGCNLVIQDVNHLNKTQILKFNYKGKIELFKIIDYFNKKIILVVDIEHQKTNTSFSFIDVNLHENKIVMQRKKELKNIIINLVATSYDMTLLACYSSLPEPILTIFSFYKMEELSKIKVIESNKSKEKIVKDISFFFQDSKRIFIIGDKLIKMYLYSKSNIKLIYNIKTNLSLINHSWFNKNEAICLDKYSRLYIAEPQQNLLKCIHKNVDDKTCVNLIEYILAFGRVKGFLLIRSTENKVYYYDSLFRLRAIIEKKSFSSGNQNDDECIIKICLNKIETKLAAISNKKHVYTFDLNNLFTNSNLDKNIFEFDIMVNNYHYNSITTLSNCIMKPIIATYSLDKNLMIWNYETHMIEYKQSYSQKDDELLTATLHPSGLNLILTTTNSLKYMAIYIESLKEVISLKVRNCMNCIFSNSGNLFAFLHGTVIQIYSSIELEEIGSIKTQEMGKIRQLRFSPNDNYLFSCSMAGIIRIWNPYTQTQLTEILTTGLSYIGFALHYDQNWIFLISTEKSLRKLHFPEYNKYKSMTKQNNEAILLKKLDTNVEENVTCIEISNNCKLICVGMTKGYLKLYETYYDRSKQYRGHVSAITKICFSFNDELMISSSEDGSILFWNINKSFRTNEQNSLNCYQLNDQILINESDYLKISDLTRDYETKVNRCKNDTNIKLRLKQIQFNNKIRNLDLKFNNLLVDMFYKINLVDCETKTQIVKLNKTYFENIKIHLRKYNGLNEFFKAKIILENKNIIQTKENITLMKQEIEKNEITFKNLMVKANMKKLNIFENNFKSSDINNQNVITAHQIKIEELINFEDHLEKEVKGEISKIKREFNRKIINLNRENNDLLVELKQFQDDEQALRKMLNDATKLTKIPS